jgi:hypothetical protein
MIKLCYQLSPTNKNRSNGFNGVLSVVLFYRGVFCGDFEQVNFCYLFKVCNFFITIDINVSFWEVCKKFIANLIKVFDWHMDCIIFKYV